MHDLGFVATTRDEGGEKRAVARKSTGAKRAELDNASSTVAQVLAPTVRWESKGEHVQAQAERAEGKKFVKHDCGPQCVAEPQYR